MAMRYQAIRLLEQDPDLADRLPEGERAIATAAVVVKAVHVPVGPLDPKVLRSPDNSPYGLLVMEGLLDRQITLGETTASHMVGPGDLIGAGWGATSEILVPATVEWRVVTPAVLALLDRRFLAAAGKWPDLMGALLERVGAQAGTLGLRSAILQMPRVADRVHALLWYLADRWGRVTPSGVLLPIRLTHAMIGRLIGARRSTVSLAMRALEDAGMLRRNPDEFGTWHLLPGDPEQTATRAGVGIATGVSASGDGRQPTAAST
jgi:CRP-like cAMP-binding protein